MPTGYRRWFEVTVTRAGVSEVLEPVSGSLTQDKRRNGRWDGRLSFVGTDLMPTSPGDLLTPFGSTVSVRMGLELIDGTVSSVPYGVYDISSASTTVTADSRTTDISLIDLSDRVERYRFETPFTVSAASTSSQMVRAVFINRTGRDPNISAVSTPLGVKWVFGLDPGTAPWSEVLDVLGGQGWTARYDRSGQLAILGINQTESGFYTLGDLTSLSADFDIRPANVVVARGEAASGATPVQAVAMDTDPGSPTYAGTTPGSSPYGRKTEFFSSPLIRTVGEAQIAADAALAASVGAGATYTMTRPYDPTIDAGDLVSSGGDNYWVDSVTVDLTGETGAKLRKLA